MLKRGIIVFLGILTAFVLGMLLLYVEGYDAIGSYFTMLKYSLFSSFALGTTLNRTVLLTLTGLSAAIALGSGAANLGQFGQLLTGGMVATVIGLYVNAPAPILIPLMFISAALAGALFSGLAAFFRLRFGMNEFISTLMLNFIAQYTSLYLIQVPLFEPGSSRPMSRKIMENGILPGIDAFDGSILIVVVIFIAVYIYWIHTKQGYELRMMGANKQFTLVGGCKTDRNFVTAMLISGALAGVAGAILIMGSNQQNRFLQNIGMNFANDGIMVAIIAAFSVPGVMFYAFLFSIMQAGATGMQLETSVPSEFSMMLQAITVILVVAFRVYAPTAINKISAIIKSKSISERKKNYGTDY